MLRLLTEDKDTIVGDRVQSGGSVRPVAADRLPTVRRNHVLFRRAVLVIEGYAGARPLKEFAQRVVDAKLFARGDDS
jgi:hypothetical protein